EPAKPRRGHRAGPGKAEHTIRRTQSGAADAPCHQLCPGCDVSRKSTSTRLRLCQDGNWLVRHAQRAHAMASADRNDVVRDQRMQMKVLVSIDVVEREAGCTVGAELCFDLGPQLRANRWP